MNKLTGGDNIEKQRVDALLVERGLFESRERAQRALMAGQVMVDGVRVEKAGTRIRRDAAIDVKGTEKYVSRGGYKLEAALDTFQVDPAGRTCLDIGASTGGFTDCLLQSGAAKVHAFDVGHGQLHWKIRSDDRVRVREKINCRSLVQGDVGETVSLIVVDVSFISLTLIIPPAFQLLDSDGTMIVLIKPQFEVAREDVGKGGIITDPALRRSAVARVETLVASMQKKWCGVIESPITGMDGNVEYLACLRP